MQVDCMIQNSSEHDNFLIKRKRAYTKAVLYSKATIETLQIYKSEVDWTVRCKDKLLNDANRSVLWVLHPEVSHDMRHCNVQLQLSNTATCRSEEKDSL